MVDPQEALRYHAASPPGKLEIRATKPFTTQRDLSLAYSPGVAEPCREIHKDPSKVFDYTSKGNLVAVVSNGTAVLGLGDIGPEAGKPVMEGKAVLFKRFGGIDVFDIEVDEKDVDKFCDVVAAIAPTFGGINLEDIKAPDCFVIEKRLRERLDIPVFHDDQHGTAIITAAGLVNALHLTGKKLDEVRIVFSGAGAAALATVRLILSMGAKRENILLCDSKGVVRTSRDDHGRNPYKAEYAADTELDSLTDALVGADVFVGVSVADAVTPDMLRSMGDQPIVFALANPDPEIPYPLAREVRPDAIVATGRSDFPNQVNNVLGFPFIFRGALDSRAREVNDEMMIAAVNALAELAREEVEDSVSAAYGGQRLSFGPEYIIPKPFDPRVLLRVAPAVALAATVSGVARNPIDDIDAYREQLEKLLGKEREVLRRAITRARSRPQRIAFADGAHPKVLRAAAQLVEEKILLPVLVGREADIRERAAELDLDLPFDHGRCRIVDPGDEQLSADLTQALYRRRCRKGMTQADAQRMVRGRNGFAAMLAREGIASGVVAGLSGGFPDTLRPILQSVGTERANERASGVHVMVINNEIFFFADTTLTLDPTVDDLTHTALATADLAHEFGVQPRVAFLSFSNFGSIRDPRAERVRQAADLVRQSRPDLEVEGEMHADIAWMASDVRELFPFMRLTDRANVLVFPSLESGNIAQKIAQCAGAEATIGPILVGLERPANILPPYASVSDIVMTATITAMLAGRREAAGTSKAVDLQQLAAGSRVETRESQVEQA